jgi:predicted ArsR family transcriptional regulator
VLEFANLHIVLSGVKALQTTRERILHILKEQDQATVDGLSQQLGLTAVTVRHHLDILRVEGLIAAPVIRRRKTPGRPQYVYRLAEKADSFFPKRYAQLTQLILEEIRTRLSTDEVNEILHHIGERIANQAKLPQKDDFKDQLVAATDFLNELGYMVRWEHREDGSYLLHVANCPYERISHQDPQVCTIDLVLLTHLLDTTPERISWSAQGDSQCSYLINSPRQQ